MPILTNTLPKFSAEARYRQLIISSMAPHEAQYIVHLEYHSRTDIDDQMLELLYDPMTRQCAEVILNLEHRVKQSIIERSLHIFLMNALISKRVKLYLAAQYRQKCHDYIHIIPENNTNWYPHEWCDPAACLVSLSNLSSRTVHENKLMHLLEDPARRCQAFEIMVLQNMAQRSDYEETYLRLLQDPDTSAYAHIMVDLKFTPNKTFEQSKYLLLLENPITRSYAKLIVNKENYAYQDLSPEEIEILIAYYFYTMTPITPCSNRIQSPYIALSFLARRATLSSHALLSSPFAVNEPHEDMQNSFFLVINGHSKRILAQYLQKLQVNNILESNHIDPNQAEEMIAYRRRTLQFIDFHLAKYFYDIGQKFDEEHLNYAVNQILENIKAPLKKNLKAIVTETLLSLIEHELLDMSARASSNTYDTPTNTTFR